MLKKYYVIKGTLHKIFYHPTKDSYRFLKEILKKRSYVSFKWKFLYYLFPFILPFLKKLTLDMKGSLVLLSFRKKVFEFENNKVYTSSLDKKSKQDIENELKIKREIKNLKINTPKILSFNYGTMIEEFVNVKTISLKDITCIVNVFFQLCDFYNFKGITKSTFRNEVNKIDLKEFESNNIIKQVKSKLQIDKEVYMTTIHGDLHLGNLGITNGQIYIFDWGSYRQDTLLGDLIWLIIHANRRFKLSKTYLDLILEVLHIVFIKTSIKINRQAFKDYFILSLLKKIERELFLNNRQEIYKDLKILKILV